MTALVKRYRRQGDLVSATILAEGAARALEAYLSPSHPALSRLTRSGDTMLDVLDPEDKDQVRASPALQAAAVLASLAAVAPKRHRKNDAVWPGFCCRAARARLSCIACALARLMATGDPERHAIARPPSCAAS